MNGESAEAKEIYQRLLDEIGGAIEDRNVGQYVGFFLLPHKLQTFETSMEVTSESEMEFYFGKILARINELGVQTLTRQCTVARFTDDATIVGYHETKLINRAYVIVEDYIALSTLKQVDGVWKVAESQYAEPDPSLPTLISGQPHKE